jgi:hypothetical protein
MVQAGSSAIPAGRCKSVPVMPDLVEPTDAYVIVKDRAAGQKLAYVYFEEEPAARGGGQPAHARRGAPGAPKAEAPASSSARRNFIENGRVKPPPFTSEQTAAVPA